MDYKFQSVTYQPKKKFQSVRSLFDTLLLNMSATDSIVRLCGKQKHGSKSDTLSCYDVMRCRFFVGVFLLGS